MTRTVADAAALLSVLAGPDPLDEVTTAGTSHSVDFTLFLDRNGLQGARLGIVRAQFGGRNDLASAVVEAQLKELEAQGAVLVDVEMPNNGKFGATELEVLYYEMKDDMAKYLAQFAPGSPFKTLQDLIDFNTKNADRELKYFGQEHFIKSMAKGGLDSKEYIDALANNHRYSRAEGIDKVMDENKLDALVAPTGAPAWITDLIRGDNSGGGFTSPAAVAGYPHITVPAGFVQGLPCGISFVGRAWSEPKLIAIAFAYEQATRRRRAPTYPKSVNPAA
jgi:amidase